MKILFCLLLLNLGALPLLAQQNNPPPSSGGTDPAQPANSPAASPSAEPQGGGGIGDLLGNLPRLDPGGELISFNGSTWNITNNRLFEARFEKYLNAAEMPPEDNAAYQALLDRIATLLAPGRATPATVDQAFALLPQASDYDMDGRICDAVSSAVYNVWLARREDQRIGKAIKSLEVERQRHEWNLKVTESQMQITQDDATKGPQQSQQQQSTRGQNSQTPGQQTDPAETNTTDTTTTSVANIDRYSSTTRGVNRLPHLTRIAEVNASLLKAHAQQELPLPAARIRFQSMLVHLFMQRRFNHVVIAAQFYRHLFGTGDEKLELRGEAERMLTGATGLPPTVAILESLSYEMMRDAEEGAEAFQFLFENKELASGSKRLSEAFAIGEHLAPLRILPRSEKRQVLDFMRKTNQLISAIDVKDYALADKLVTEMEAMATDFDSSKPKAAVETARTIATMHLAKAKNAAVSGDNATLEAELRSATEVWPRNPALQEVSSLIFRQGDMQQRALVDLDQLLGQKNYRQIFDDRARYIAAAALYPDRQEALNKALERVQRADIAIVQAGEISKRGDAAGAWESIERVYRDVPDDTRLNEVRANLTTEAAEFVRALRTGQEQEERQQSGSSLAWYLQALDLYPGSEYARAGIDRIVADLLGTPTTGATQTSAALASPVDKSPSPQ